MEHVSAFSNAVLTIPFRVKCLVFASVAFVFLVGAVFDLPASFSLVEKMFTLILDRYLHRGFVFFCSVYLIACLLADCGMIKI